MDGDDVIWGGVWSRGGARAAEAIGVVMDPTLPVLNGEVVAR